MVCNMKNDLEEKECYCPNGQKVCDRMKSFDCFYEQLKEKDEEIEKLKKENKKLSNKLVKFKNFLNKCVHEFNVLNFSITEKEDKNVTRNLRK